MQKLGDSLYDIFGPSSNQVNKFHSIERRILFPNEKRNRLNGTGVREPETLRADVCEPDRVAGFMETAGEPCVSLGRVPGIEAKAEGLAIVGNRERFAAIVVVKKSEIIVSVGFFAHGSKLMKECGSAIGRGARIVR